MTPRELLKLLSAEMAAAGVPDAEVDAQLLLSHVTGQNPLNLRLDGWSQVSLADETAFRALCEKRKTRTPLQYLTGVQSFLGRDFYVDERVLIPRPETELLAERAIALLKASPCPPVSLDLCCGSGAIGLAIASRVKDAKVTLADLSQDALSVARDNVALNKMTARVRCVSADALKPAFPFLGKFDMIVSNPPYITGEDMKTLPASVKDYEPHMALYGGEDGLDFYRSIAKNYAPALKPGGYLAFEFGEEQGDDVCRILEENGYTILERTRDYNDRERAVLAQYGRKEENYGDEKDCV